MWHSTQILALFWLVVEVTISWWIWKFLGYQSREEEEFELFQKTTTTIILPELITSD